MKRKYQKKKNKNLFIVLIGLLFLFVTLFIVVNNFSKTQSVVSYAEDENGSVINYKNSGGATNPQSPQIPADAFTVVAIPDSQSESSAVQLSVINWIIANLNTQKIALVLHLGDITNNNSQAEWDQVKLNYGKLAGKVPYYLAIGNHDSVFSTRDTIAYNAAISSFTPASVYRGFYQQGKYENVYGFVTMGGKEYIILSLETAPRNEVLSWANSVLQANPTKTAFVVTHAYLYKDNGRTRPGTDYYVGNSTTVNDGEKMWTKFVKLNKNMGFIVSGHIPGVGFRTDTADNGNKVYQMLADYQFQYGGGGGYIRLITFSPSQKTMTIKTYSPYLNNYLTDSGNNFSVSGIDFLPGRTVQSPTNSGSAYTRLLQLIQDARERRLQRQDD